MDSAQESVAELTAWEEAKTANKEMGVVKISLALGLSRGAASQWTEVPAEHVLAVERLTGVSRYRLRPDVFGADPDKK